MVLILILLIVAFIFLIAGFFYFYGLPDSRTAPGKYIKMILAGAMLCVVSAAGVSVAIMVQEKTGYETGLSGGVESDARQWVSAHEKQKPAVDQTGDNIVTLRDGLTFLKRNSQGPNAQAVIQRYSGLQERPTRLLSKSEERQYYEGASAVYKLIVEIAGNSGVVASQ